MKAILASAVALTLAGAANVYAQEIQVLAHGERPSSPGPAQYFTGHVIVDELFGRAEHSRTSGGHVTFAPGARSNWHTHPAGQTLIITSGVGWVQQDGGPKKEIRPGDVVVIPPGVRHWHGATATSGMRHIAVQDTVEGHAVHWLEPVTDEQYRR